MTAAEHQAQHQSLHAALDELIACYVNSIARAGGHPALNHSILMLIEWSFTMCSSAPAIPEPEETHP